MFLFSRYTCCSGKCNNNQTGGGCCTAKGHVWRGRLFQMPGLHGPFKNFIRTKGRKCNPPNGYHGVYALDGEMCYTTQGMELIRLSVVSLTSICCSIWPQINRLNSTWDFLPRVILVGLKKYF